MIAVPLFICFVFVFKEVLPKWWEGKRLFKKRTRKVRLAWQNKIEGTDRERERDKAVERLQGSPWIQSLWAWWLNATKMSTSPPCSRVVSKIQSPWQVRRHIQHACMRVQLMQLFCFRKLLKKILFESCCDVLLKGFLSHHEMRWWATDWIIYSSDKCVQKVQKSSWYCRNTIQSLCFYANDFLIWTLALFSIIIKTFYWFRFLHILSTDQRCVCWIKCHCRLSYCASKI